MKKVKIIMTVGALLASVQVTFAQIDSNYYKPGPAEYSSTGNATLDPAQNTMQMYNSTIQNNATQQSQFSNTNSNPTNGSVDFNNNTSTNPANDPVTNTPASNGVNFSNTLPGNTTPPPGSPSPTDYSGGINTGNVNNPR